jgi:Family of unknown function (DUF5681)
MRRKATSDQRDAADVRSGAKEGGGEYEVGYGKPPRASQWAKGRSGNYAGRPRKKKSPLGPSYSFDPYLESFFKEMSRPVGPREGEQSIGLSVFEALLREMINHGLKGDYRAAKFLVEKMEAAAERRQKDISRASAVVEEYKARWPSQMAEARAKGKRPPLPHPDHLNFSYERGVPEITGPTEYEKAVLWEELKEQLRLVEAEIKDAEDRPAEDPSSDEAKAALRRSRRWFKRFEKFVPPGWDWREKVDLKPFL